MKGKKQSPNSKRLVRDFTRTELFEDAKLIYKKGQEDERELVTLTCAHLAKMIRDREDGL